MKKSIAIIALVVAAASTTFAQGLVFFNNQNSTRISTNTVANGAATGTISPVAGTFYFALFYSTSQTTVGGSTNSTSGLGSTYVFSAAGWTDAGLIGTNSLTSGRFASSSSDSLNNSVVSGLPGVTQASFVIVGWSIAGVTTVSQLINWYNSGAPATGGFLGESGVTGLITTGNGGTQVTPQLFGVSSPQVGGFTLGLVPVPEPATMVLAGLGGLSLLALRRKK